MIDLEEIRSMATRNPHMRINTLLHLLEKRKKVEELREEHDQRTAFNHKEPPTSFFQWLLNGGK